MVRLESRPSNIEGKGAVTIRDLVRNSLRMRPDRIVVGEVRDASALDMLQAMNTGHDGSICTVHSNGPRDTCSRLETLVLMAGMDLPVRAIREQVASAVDLIVHQARLKDGTRRITHVTEVERMEGDVITLQDIFLFDNSAGFDSEGRSLGSLKATGLRPKFLEKMQHNNVARGPADLRHLHGLPMTRAVAARHRARSWGCSSALLSLALLASAPASRGRRRGHRPRPADQGRRSAARLGPRQRQRSTTTRSRSPSPARRSMPRPPPRRRATERAAHLDPGDRHQQQHGRAQRIAEAKKAALAYLATVPANVKVGVVTFDDTVKTLVAPDARPSGRDAGHRRADADPAHRAVRRRARRAQGRRSGRRRRRPAEDPGPLGRQGHDDHQPQRRARRDRAVRCQRRRRLAPAGRRRQPAAQRDRRAPARAPCSPRRTPPP